MTRHGHPIRRIFRLGHPRDETADVTEEVAFHLDMRTRELVRRGWTPEAARAEALRAFGDVDDAVAYCQRMDEERLATGARVELLRDIRQDLRYAVRSLRRAPVFAATVALTLALGVGMNVAVFGILDRLLLRPIDVARPAGLVALHQVDATRGERADQISYGDFTDIRERRDLFDGVALIASSSATLTDDTGAERIQGRRVSPAFFPLLDVQPMLGRGFLPEDDRSAGGRVVLLGHGFWTERFGSDPAVLGRDVRLNGEPHTVIGVLPASFDLPYPDRHTQLWLPLFDTPERVSNRTFWGYWAIARLRNGVSVDRASGAIAELGARLEDAHPETNASRRFAALDLSDVIVGERRPMLFALAGAAAAVLLVAAANLANLFLVRAAGRRRELAIRQALGAAAGRLVRQVAVEALLLASAGAVVGIALAAAVLRALAQFALLPPVAIDGRMIALGVLLATCCGLACGIWPVLAVRRGSAAFFLRGDARASAGREERRVTSAFVTAQIALALVLLVASGLLLATVHAALLNDVGFDRERVLAFRLFPAAYRYADLEQTMRFYGRAREVVASVPGVQRVALTSTLPLGNRMGASLNVRDRPTPPGTSPPTVTYGSVMPGYFATLGIPVLRGRDFAARDLSDSAHVTIISDEVARTVFAGEDPIGREISLGATDGDWHRVIGVVGSVRHEGLIGAAAAAAYELSGEHWSRAMWVVVRAERDPLSLVAAIRGRLNELDPEVPMYEVATMDERASSSLADQRLALRLLGIFGGIAVLLSAVGIYGVTAQMVAQRTRELGIRQALGATRMRVVGSVLRGSLVVIGVGLSLGCVAAVVTTRLLRALLFGVSPTEPGVLLACALLLGTMAAIAALVPASRAARVDPLIALRAE